MEFYNVFSGMHGNKSYNQAGMQPYTINETSEYLSIIGITKGERKAKFLRVLRLLDATYISHTHEKA